MNCNVVFDSNSSNSCHIDPRLDRNDHPRFKPDILAASDSGVFVNFQTQPMPRTMHKILV